jgi:hypothetical protein
MRSTVSCQRRVAINSSQASDNFRRDAENLGFRLFFFFFGFGFEEEVSAAAARGGKRGNLSGSRTKIGAEHDLQRIFFPTIFSGRV